MRIFLSGINGIVIAILLIQGVVTGMPVSYAQDSEMRDLLGPLVRFEHRELTPAGRNRLRDRLKERRRQIQNDTEKTEEQKKAGQEFEEVNKGKKGMQDLSTGALVQGGHVAQTYLYILLFCVAENERLASQEAWDSGKPLQRDYAKEIMMMSKLLTQDGSLVSAMGGSFTFNVALKPVTKTIDKVYLSMIQNKLFRALMGSGIGTLITFSGWEIGRELWTEAKLMLDQEEYEMAQGDYYTFGSAVRVLLLKAGAGGAAYGIPNSAMQEDPKKLSILKKIFQNMAFILFNDPDRRDVFLYNVFRHNILNGDFATLVASLTVSSAFGSLLGGYVGTAATPVLGTVAGTIVGLVFGTIVGFLGGIAWLFIPRDVKDDITLGFKNWRFLNSVTALRMDQEKFQQLLKENKWPDREYFSHVLAEDPDYMKEFDRRNSRDAALERINDIVVFLNKWIDGSSIKPKPPVTPNEDVFASDPKWEDQIDEWIKQEYDNLERPMRSIEVVYPHPTLQRNIQRIAKLMFESSSLKTVFRDQLMLRNHMMYQFPHYYEQQIKSEPVYSGQEKVFRDQILATGLVTKLKLDSWIREELEHIVDPEFLSSSEEIAYPNKDIASKVHQIVQLSQESIMFNEFFDRRQQMRERMVDTLVEFAYVNHPIQDLNMQRAHTIRKYLDDWIIGSDITKEQMEEWIRIEFQNLYPRPKEDPEKIRYPHKEFGEHIQVMVELVVTSIKRAELFSSMTDIMLETFDEEETLYAALIRKFTLAKTQFKINKETNPRQPAWWGVVVRDPDRMIQELHRELKHFQAMKSFYIALFLGLTPQKTSLLQALDFKVQESDFEVLYELKINAQGVQDALLKEQMDAVEKDPAKAQEQLTGVKKVFGESFVSDMMKGMYKQISFNIISGLYYESVKEDRIIYYTSFE